MTKLSTEWVRTSDPVIRSPARYRWTTAPAWKQIGITAETMKVRKDRHNWACRKSRKILTFLKKNMNIAQEHSLSSFGGEG